jgi:AcrR family transcriptional regulator
MKQRKKQPVQTRRAILEAAGAEFVRHGYAGAGLGAIVARAEMTKGALFHHFTDKRAMAVAWVEDELAPAVGARWMEPLEQVGSLDALKAFCRARCVEMDALDETSALVALAAETAITEPALAAALERVFAAWRAALAALLERGKAAGWIHRSIRPAAEAAFLVSAVAGFAVTTRAMADEAMRRNCASALEGYLETLRAQ